MEAQPFCKYLGGSGSLPQVCPLFPTQNALKCFLIHTDLGMHLWYKKLDYRPWGNNFKTNKPPSHPHAAKPAWSVLEQLWKGRKTQGQQAERWRAKAMGKFWGLTVLPLISSLKFSVASMVSPEYFSSANAAGIPMLITHAHTKAAGIKWKSKLRSFKC